MLKKILLTIMVICTFAMSCFAKVMPLKLEKLIQYSDYIVIGKVTKVYSIEKEEIAELEISRVVKGKTSLTYLFFYASKTWTCDVSNAEDGESGIYFLQQSYKPKNPSKDQLDFLQKINPITQGAPLFFITHSGYGRMVSKPFEEKEYVQSLYDMVLFPSTINVLRHSESEFPYKDFALITIDDVVNFVEKYQNTRQKVVKKQREQR